jgi:hypothetical protein
MAEMLGKLMPFCASAYPYATHEPSFMVVSTQAMFLESLLLFVNVLTNSEKSHEN